MTGLRKTVLRCLVGVIFVIFVGCANAPQQVAGPDQEPEVKDSEAELAEAKEELPVHPWHEERVNNIRVETIEQVIENLANFDDMLFATTVSGARGYKAGRLPDEVSRVVHLFRVRRLWAEGKENPELVIRLLRAAYKQGLADFPQGCIQLDLEVKEMESQGRSVTFNKPNLFGKSQTKAVVATYLLAELQDHDSLPLLLEGFTLQNKWVEQGDRIAPVPPAMTLYAIHRLVCALPAEQMNLCARSAQKSYMKWAAKHLPLLKEIEGTAWNADYDESDVYRRIVDPEGRVLAGQPRVTLTEYPVEFADGTPMDDPEMTKEWAGLLLRFVEAAYPDANLSEGGE